MTTKEDIKQWLDEAKPEHTHMMIICDQFDYEDYPVYISKGDDAREKADEYNRKDMKKVMEIYNLNLPFDSQLNEDRSFNF